MQCDGYTISKVGETDPAIHVLQRGDPGDDLLSSDAGGRSRGKQGPQQDASLETQTTKSLIAPGHGGRYGRPLTCNGATGNSCSSSLGFPARPLDVDGAPEQFLEPVPQITSRRREEPRSRCGGQAYKQRTISLVPLHGMTCLASIDRQRFAAQRNRTLAQHTDQHLNRTRRLEAGVADLEGCWQVSSGRPNSRISD